jgi:cytosine/adenosine deaminase-related metal-dependent hydrolase
LIVAGRTLLKGGCVLTLGAKTPNFTEANVLIEDGKVAEVGPGLRARDAEQVDATDTIVMPGFVDTHRHVWKSLFRNLGAAAGVDRSHYRPDDVYAATLIGLLGAVEAGITTVVDWADIPVEGNHTEAALQAHLDAGLRTVYVHSSPSDAGSRAEVGPSLRRLVSGHSDAGDTPTTIALGPDDPDRSNLDRVAREWSLARDLGLRIHAHVGLKASDAGVVASLAQQSLLGADVTLVHCAHLDDEDLDAIASSGASVVLTPLTEMTGGTGMPPLQRFLDRHIEPGLGVDSEREAPGDIFAQMRATNSVQHAAYFDLKLAGKAGLPNLLTTRDVIRYATTVGARAVGLGEVTGSLEPGKQADIIVLRTDRPNIYPINDPIGAVVWGMDTSNLDWVFAGGRALMRNGELEADAAQARDLAVEAQHRVAAAVGLLAESGVGEEG